MSVSDPTLAVSVPPSSDISRPWMWSPIVIYAAIDTSPREGDSYGAISSLVPE